MSRWTIKQVNYFQGIMLVQAIGKHSQRKIRILPERTKHRQDLQAPWNSKPRRPVIHSYSSKITLFETLSHIQGTGMWGLVSEGLGLLCPRGFAEAPVYAPRLLLWAGLVLNVCSFSRMMVQAVGGSMNPGSAWWWPPLWGLQPLTFPLHSPSRGFPWGSAFWGCFCLVTQAFPYIFQSL